MNGVRHASAFAVEATRLCKSFGKIRALNGIDLLIPTGMVYGFLGPNGAGKTTAIRILSTLLRPDAGYAKVLGYDVVKQANEVRWRVSLTGQFASVDEDLTGLENLVLLARLRGFTWSEAKKRALDLFDFFELKDAASRQVKTYSGGMRRRIDIAASIVVTPDLLFLDEPTTGLDPRNRSQIWDIIRSLVRDGITVFLTTQYLDEADNLADRIGVIDNGRIIAEGTSGQLKSLVGSGVLHVWLEDPENRIDAEKVLSRRPGIQTTLEPDPAEISVRIPTPEEATSLLADLSASGIRVSNFSFGQPSLDEVFLTLTGRSAEAIYKERVK